MLPSVLRTLASIAVWAFVHSVLATRSSKQLAADALGERNRNGLYRIAYNGIAVASTAVLLWYLHRLPDRTLYTVRGAGRSALRGLQVLLLLSLCAAALEIGIGPFSGVSELLDWALRRHPAKAPEAQGPALGAGGLRTAGPFRWVRHPLNFSATALTFAVPEMTAVRLTVALATLAYSLVGSKLEEQRLLTQYGDPYRRYMESGVPFFLPSLRPRI